MTALVKTRLVVRRGRTGRRVEGSCRENFSGRGAKIEMVPVPVLCFLFFFVVERLTFSEVREGENRRRRIRRRHTGLYGLRLVRGSRGPDRGIGILRGAWRRRRRRRTRMKG